MENSIKEFVAKGNMIYDQTTFPAIVKGSIKTISPDAIQCMIMPDLTLVTDKIFSKDFEYFGKTDDGEEVWFEANFRYFSSTSSKGQISWKGYANQFIKGDLDQFGLENGEILVFAYLPPTALVNRSIFSFIDNGTIERHSAEMNESIVWDTPIGQAELSESYKFLNEEFNLENVQTRIRRCQIKIHISGDGLVSLKQILASLSDQLNDSLLLISFFSQKRISCYEAEALYVPLSSSSNKYKRAFFRASTWLGYLRNDQTGDRWVNLLVKRTELQSGLFQKLLESYTSSPYKDVIRGVIIHILTSYEEGYFESHISEIYLAFEGLINGLCSDDDPDVGKILGGNKFKKLQRKLKATITEEIPEKRLADSIITKLGELNRRAIHPRLMILLSRHKVPFTMIWNDVEQMESELSEILQRRNLLIHTGKFDDFPLYYGDFIKLRLLCEIWILKLLKCPDEKLAQEAIARIYRTPTK